MSRFFPNLSQHHYEENKAEIAAALRSLYFPWWRCLCLSQEYWRLCQVDGKTGDPAFARVYKHFGDVFKGDFGLWWTKRGKQTFAHKVRPPRVRFANPSDLEEIMRHGVVPNAQVLVIPDHYSKTDLIKQFRKLLGDFEPGPLPKAYASPFEVGDLRGIKRSVLNDILKVWVTNEAIKIIKAHQMTRRPELLTHAWIGKVAEIQPERRSDKVRTSATDRNERLALRVKVSRYLLKASRLIVNAEIGDFPSLSPLTPNSKRWTSKQLEAFNAMEHDAPFRSPLVKYEDFYPHLP